MMELKKAGTADVLVINSISKRAFDSDILVGAPSKVGPPGYKSESFYMRMARANRLYKLTNDGLILGAAILSVDGARLNIDRIFIEPEHFRKGYGIFLMREIEKAFPDVHEIVLDTPAWNVRTNAFYQKLGYIEYKRNDKFIYYIIKIAATLPGGFHNKTSRLYPFFEIVTGGPIELRCDPGGVLRSAQK